VAISTAFLPENVTVVSTNGQLAESKSVYKGFARVLPAAALIPSSDATLP
jgi:hypothetical protein